MSQPDSGQDYLVPSLLRGLEILRLFRRDRPTLSAPEIAQELEIPRTTVFRLLHTLEHLGYVVRNSQRNYYLGVSVLSLGFEYLAAQELTELARPILQRLRDQTGFSTHLVVRDGSDIVYLLRFSGHSIVNNSIAVGTRLPAHATSMGRVFLSQLSAAELQTLYPDAQLSSWSEQTPKTLQELTQLLKHDREQGYAISQGFFEPGINAIAAPVKDASSRIRAVINLIMREGEASLERLENELLQQVLTAAQELSRSLNYFSHTQRGLNEYTTEQ